MARAAIERRRRSRDSIFTLAGLLYDDAGNRMTPSHSRKDGVRYRYYVSQALLQHRRADAGSIARVSAPDVETAFAAAMAEAGQAHGERVDRVTLHRERLETTLTPNEADTTPSRIAFPFAWQPQGRRKGICHEPAHRPRIEPAQANVLLCAVGKARLWMAELIAGTAASTDAIALREGMGERNVRKLLPLACLSPNVLRAIADSSAPANLTIRQLTAALPHDWSQQERQFLIA